MFKSELGYGLGPRCTGVVAERRPGYSETSPCRLWINKGDGKHRPRGCGPQKSRTLLQPKKAKDPFGVLRPEFIHVTMRYGAPRILLILKSDGVFGTHNRCTFVRTATWPTGVDDHPKPSLLINASAVSGQLVAINDFPVLMRTMPNWITFRLCRLTVGDAIKTCSPDRSNR